MPQPAPFVPERLGDFNEALARYTLPTAHTSNEYTLIHRSKAWAFWNQHCEDLGYEVGPDVPASVWLALWASNDAHGRPLLHDGLYGLVSAIKVGHRQRQWPIPIEAPEHVGAWKDACRGHAVGEALRIDTDDRRRDIQLLTRTDVIPMVTSVPESSAQRRAAGAMALLALDSQWPWSRIRAVTRSDMSARPGGLQVQDLLLFCEHSLLVPGVPRDCTVCALEAVLRDREEARSAGLGIDDRLFCLGPDYDVFLRLLRDRMPGLEAGRRSDTTVARLVQRDGLDDWHRAGLRRALWVATGMIDGSRWLRARAWVTTAWINGFRMCSDLRELHRSRVTDLDDGSGLELALAATKDDRGARKDQHRILSWDDEISGASPASVMTEYLAVRDATVGRGGSLIVKVASNKASWMLPGTLSARNVYVTAAGDLGLLCRLARIDRSYTSYSTRKGFAAQAYDDGWQMEEAQKALRHADLQTTRDHYWPESGSRTANDRLMGQLP